MAADPRKVSVYIPDEVLAQVQAWARANNRSMSYCIQQALMSWASEGHPEAPLARKSRTPKEGV